jgi:hypothetical protein
MIRFDRAQRRSVTGRGRSDNPDSPATLKSGGRRVGVGDGRSGQTPVRTVQQRSPTSSATSDMAPMSERVGTDDKETNG